MTPTLLTQVDPAQPSTWVSPVTSMKVFPVPCITCYMDTHISANNNLLQVQSSPLKGLHRHHPSLQTANPICCYQYNLITWHQIVTALTNNVPSTRQIYMGFKKNSCLCFAAFKWLTCGLIVALMSLAYYFKCLSPLMWDALSVILKKCSDQGCQWITTLVGTMRCFSKYNTT